MFEHCASGSMTVAPWRIALLVAASAATGFTGACDNTKVGSNRPSCPDGLQTFRESFVPANLRGTVADDGLKLEVKSAGTRGEWRLCEATVSMPLTGLPAELHMYGVRWFDDQHSRVEVQRFR
jgi:hypothetical protein